ncbi:Uncharacterised protein [Mycobacterium tuberculosis]|nr:Uncharacterised protein [Mycobacterium tuberculosis]CKT34300.1 Uncharacterised protein [Mycobacterium tuberculosis]
MSSQRTARLPTSVRTVTPRSSASVRSRMIDADNATGMTNSGALTGQVSTGTSRPRVRNPTAKCAIGDTLITTGDVVATPASSHRLVGVEFASVTPPRKFAWDFAVPSRSRIKTDTADLTAELCEGYRRTLWTRPESPGCS